MLYLLEAYKSEWKETASVEEREAYDRACSALAAGLQASGYLLAGAHLEDARSAVTVRVQDDHVILAGASFTHLEESLAEVYFIYAKDLNEAVRVAARMPQARRGLIVVRPAREPFNL